jgi:hypothetical protein
MAPQERQPQEFSRDLRFYPLRMVPPDALLGQFSSKEAHFKCHEQTFFSPRRPQNLELDSLRPGTCIGGGHIETFSTQCPAVRAFYPPAIAPSTTSGSFPDTTASGSGASGDS